MKIDTYSALNFAIEDCKVDAVTGYAGTIASNYIASVNCKIQAINETTSLQIAHMYSYLGKRSISIMKNAGINQAALPFRNICDIGVNAGMVLIVTDDISAEMSENKQDSRIYQELGKTLILEPKSAKELYEMLVEGFELSEKLEILVIIRITNELVNKKSEHINRKILPKRKENRAELSQKRWVLNPIHTEEVIKYGKERYEKVKEYVEFSRFNKLNLSGKNGYVYSQCLNSKEEKIIKNDDSVLEIGTFPMPISLTNKFFKHVDNVKVIDSGEEYLLKTLRSVRDQTKYTRIERNYKWPGLPLKTSSKWLDYTPLFNHIKDRKPDIVVGDFGSYTMAIDSPIEYALFYGGAIGSGIAASLAGLNKVYVVIGDGGFSTSIQSLIELKRKNLKVNIIIIKNNGISKKESININLNEIASSIEIGEVNEISDKELNSEIFDKMDSSPNSSILIVDYSNSGKSLPLFTINKIKNRFKA